VKISFFSQSNSLSKSRSGPSKMIQPLENSERSVTEMRIINWSPWGELDTFRRSFERAFGEDHGAEGANQHTWTPSANIYEDENSFTIVLDLPGVEKDGAELNVEEGVLRIKAEKKTPAVEGKTLLREELTSGAYERTFTIGDTVEEEKITAELKDGVLTISLPKKAEVKPKKIEVKVV